MREKKKKKKKAAAAHGSLSLSQDCNLGNNFGSAFWGSNGRILVISDPRRGCYMGLSGMLYGIIGDAIWDYRGCYMGLSGMLYGIIRVHFFFLKIFFRAISLEPLLAETPIQCAAWSCGLIVHCCLPFNFLRYYFFFFPRQDFVRAIFLEQLLAETPIQCAAWSCGLILHCCLPFNSLSYFFFFRHDFVRAISWNRYLQGLQIDCAAWSCGLILHCYLPSNLLSYFFSLPWFPPPPPPLSLPRFCPGHLLR